MMNEKDARIVGGTMNNLNKKYDKPMFIASYGIFCIVAILLAYFTETFSLINLALGAVIMDLMLSTPKLIKMLFPKKIEGDEI